MIEKMNESDCGALAGAMIMFQKGKLLVRIFILLAFVSVGHVPATASPPVSPSETGSGWEEREAVPVPDGAPGPERDEMVAGVAQDRPEPEKRGIWPGTEQTEFLEEGEEEIPEIADPLEPWNWAMFQFNDKFYFWALKPATQVYSHVVPEPFRIVLGNFYDNLKAPVRFANHLLQMNFKDAGNELIRFVFNSFAGIGGLGDTARDALGIKKRNADLGQTLGHYGIGHGIYLIWPVLGPSSLRDSTGIAGDWFLYPLGYVASNDVSFGTSSAVLGHEMVNRTSFRIGDYESFKESTLDPYVSLRDAFVQSRKRAVEESRR